MLTLRTFIFWLISLLAITGGLIFVIANWSWVFAKRIQGEIIQVERVTDPTAILGRATEQQIHSYSIMIKESGNGDKLYVASGEDRQWQVIHKGCVVNAVFYVYPPWQLEKSGTYFNARLKDVLSCPKQEAPPESEPKG